MNGVIMGVKGFLSFLSAPLIGALSDVWGRKIFLFITAFFTCLPIPFLLVSITHFIALSVIPCLMYSFQLDSTVYFVTLTISGIFSIIFSVAFAYVSDVTEESGEGTNCVLGQTFQPPTSERSLGYGLVTAGFAASLILSPALGAGIELATGSETLVILTASLVAVADVAFILLLLPESLNTSSKLKLQSLTFKQVGGDKDLELQTIHQFSQSQRR